MELKEKIQIETEKPLQTVLLGIINKATNSELKLFWKSIENRSEERGVNSGVEDLNFKF